MPPYCIVCNKDLALDPAAEPPLCGAHAEAKRIEAQLPTMDTRVVRILSGKEPVNRVYTATITIDRTDNTAPYATQERIHVESAPYGRGWYDSDGGGSYTEDDRIRLQLIQLHNRLTDDGWRLFCLNDKYRYQSILDGVNFEYSFERSYVEPAYGYKYCPNVPEFYLWDLTGGREISADLKSRVTEELSAKFRPPVIQTPAPPSKRKRLFGLF